MVSVIKYFLEVPWMKEFIRLQKEIKEKREKTTVEETMLNKRIKRALSEAGIMNMEEVHKLSERQLLGIKGIGPKYAIEVIKANIDTPHNKQAKISWVLVISSSKRRVEKV